MFLLISLLFVTAAVLVDKPETPMEERDLTGDRIDGVIEMGRDTENFNESQNFFLSLDKLILYGSKDLLFKIQNDADEDLPADFMDKTDLRPEQEGILLENTLTSTSQDLEDEASVNEEFEISRYKRDVMRGISKSPESRHFEQRRNDELEITNISDKHRQLTKEEEDDNVVTEPTNNDDEDILPGGSSEWSSLKKRKKLKRRVFDPWMFETEIGEDADRCFDRLSLTKSQIEDYTLVSSSEARLTSMKITLINMNYTRSRNDDDILYRRSIDDTAEESDDPGLSDMAVEQGYAPPMLVSQEMVPDCHFLYPYKGQWIKLISSCPSSWSNATVEHLCLPRYRDIQDDNAIDLLNLPVQDDKGIVYRNIFCAQCNKANDFKAWDVVVLCDGTSSLFFIDGNVMMAIMPKLAAATHCRKTLWPRLPDKVETCLMTKRRTVRHAGERNGRNEEELVTYPVSFSVLMNFGFDGKTHILFSTTHEETASETVEMCKQPNQVYDYRNKQCRTIGCPAGYKLVGEECLTDDISEPVPSTDELLPDVQTLTHLPDVAVITLTVNATYSNLLAIMSPAFRTIMVEGMATLFNISSERIQNFTVERVNSSNPGPEVAVHTLNEQPVLQPAGNLLGSQSPDGDFPSEEGSPKLLTAPKTRKTQTERPLVSTSNSYGESSSVSSSQKNDQTTSLHKHTVTEARSFNGKKEYILQKLENKVNLQNYHQSHVTVMHHEKKSPTTTTSLPANSLLDLLSQKTISLKLKFLLLPPRSSMLNEGTVSSVKEKMNSLFKQKKFTLSLNGTEVTVVDMVDKDDHEGTFCSNGQMQFYFADQLDIINAKDNQGNTVTHVMVNSTNNIYGPGKFDLTLWVAGNVGSDTNVTDVMGYAFVCVMPRVTHTNCPRFTLNHTEYVLLPNKSILWGERLRTMAEYQYLDETKGLITICVPDSILHPNKTNDTSIFVIHGCDKGFEKFKLAEAYMTAVLGRISIIALALVLLTYLLFARLRNLPGVNTMNLTLALLIAESIFITGERAMDPPWLCSLVAISLHYFFLASFFWMNVMSFDVFRTFANSTYVLPHIREKSKYLCRYVLYCWGSPAVIVSACVILDFTKIIPGVQIGYGYHQDYDDAGENTTVANTTDESINTTDGRNDKLSVSLGCWIHNPIGSLTAFGAPILIILLINIYLFVKTILCIQKSARFTMHHTRRSSVNRKTGRNDVILYVRMSTVMGFTWVFGLASSVVSALSDPPSNVACYAEHIIVLLFVIFNCSQGLFIFFAFVCKRRVFGLYKGLWFRIITKVGSSRTGSRKRHQSGSNSSTSSSTISTIS